MNTGPNRRAGFALVGLVLAGGALLGIAGGSSASAWGGAAASPRAFEHSLGFEEVTSNDGTYRVRYRLDPEVIEFGELFSLELEIERTDGEPLLATLAVDARMPEHHHGMNREPLVESKGAGAFLVTNLYFHMPGYWEAYMDLTRGAVTERAQFPIDVD